MSRMSEIDADLYSASENYYGYAGHIGQPILEEIHILMVYEVAKDRLENIYAYTTYDLAIQAKLEAEKCNKESHHGQEDREFFIDTVQLKS